MSVVWFRAARGVSQFVLNIATRIGTVTAECLFKRICRIWGSNKLADAMTVLSVFFLLCGAYEIHTIRKVGKTRRDDCAQCLFPALWGVRNPHY